MIRRSRIALVLFCLVVPCAGPPARCQSERIPLFRDAFEGNLDGWYVSDPAAISIVDGGDERHGRVLELRPEHARLYALIRGSESWGGYRIEGQVRFPTDEQNYLGLIYHYREADDGRADLGSIYIKGNGSYLQVNPRRDWNPGRRLYPERRVDLVGADAIRIGRWQRFAAEVLGDVCHFYVGDMERPKLTFAGFEHDSGRAGFKPRVVGGPVQLDDVVVTAIDALTYRGPDIPLVKYAPEGLVTDWEVLGPLERVAEELEREPRPTGRPVIVNGAKQRWRKFETDRRGCAITARVVDFLGPRTVGYFRTSIRVESGVTAELRFSTLDDMAIWLDGHFEGYSYGDTNAWYDFGENPEHPPSPRTALPLHSGENHVVIRVRGGRYAAGGFFARVWSAAATGGP